MKGTHNAGHKNITTQSVSYPCLLYNPDNNIIPFQVDVNSNILQPSSKLEWKHKDEFVSFINTDTTNFEDDIELNLGQSRESLSSQSDSGIDISFSTETFHDRCDNIALKNTFLNEKKTEIDTSQLFLSNIKAIDDSLNSNKYIQRFRNYSSLNPKLIVQKRWMKRRRLTLPGYAHKLLIVNKPKPKKSYSCLNSFVQYDSCFNDLSISDTLFPKRGKLFFKSVIINPPIFVTKLNDFDSSSTVKEYLFFPTLIESLTTVSCIRNYIPLMKPISIPENFMKNSFVSNEKFFMPLKSHISRTHEKILTGAGDRSLFLVLFFFYRLQFIKNMGLV